MILPILEIDDHFFVGSSVIPAAQMVGPLATRAIGGQLVKQLADVSYGAAGYVGIAAMICTCAVGIFGQDLPEWAQSSICFAAPIAVTLLAGLTVTQAVTYVAASIIVSNTFFYFVD